MPLNYIVGDAEDLKWLAVEFIVDKKGPLAKYPGQILTECMTAEWLLKEPSGGVGGLRVGCGWWRAIGGFSRSGVRSLSPCVPARGHS